MRHLFLVLLLPLCACVQSHGTGFWGDGGEAETTFVEAEGFDELGGWVLDQQFMDLMGSPYLLAHGLGYPVSDARTEVHFKTEGLRRVWVRTKDWVAPWNAPGAPGRFQLVVNGKPLATTFGTKGAKWHWQDGGYVDVSHQATVALHDLTGFEGRCDAVVFSADLNWKPPEDQAELEGFRRKSLGLSLVPEKAGKFDLWWLVVVWQGVVLRLQPLDLD